MISLNGFGWEWLSGPLRHTTVSITPALGFVILYAENPGPASPGPVNILVNLQARALELLAAIDRGGIPTDPILVNNLARGLGLAVEASAPMRETIERIRSLLAQ
jgi:hypothetical protein